MFPNPVRVTLAISLGLFPGLLATSQEPASKEVAGIQLPYPANTKIIYEWRQGGTKVGSTEFVVEPLQGDRAGQTRIESKWAYSYKGRRHDATGETILKADLHPRSYEGRVGTFTAPGYSGSSSMEAIFEGQRVRMTVTTQGAPAPKSSEIKTSPAVYIYENQAFEHWAVLAPVIHSRRPATLELFVPATASVLKFTVTRSTRPMPHGKETEGSEPLQHWRVEHPSMKAQLWLSRDGALEVYRQGDLEIRRLASGAPKAKPAKGS